MEIIGETVEINHDSKLYYGIIINNNKYYLKVYLLKKYCTNKNSDDISDFISFLLNGIAFDMYSINGCWH